VSSTATASRGAPAFSSRRISLLTVRRYARFFDKTLKWSRPCLIECMFCTNFTVDSLHLKDAAFWNVHPYASRDVVVRDLLITAPPWAANTDGVDPDSCSNVRLRIKNTTQNLY
jgi:polygalacturonase